MDTCRACFYMRPAFYKATGTYLKLDKDNGRIRTLYYMVGAAVLWIPTILMSGYLATATGKLTVLVSIKEIAGKPATKYYKVSEYVLDQDNTGIESVISYSGKHNQYLNFDIYIAIPIIADLYDTLSSPSAFLSQHFHQQVSSKISDTERGKKMGNLLGRKF
ncbi:MAG: hypothetical protein WDO71_16005 [Bacteroidota bacterium]